MTAIALRYLWKLLSSRLGLALVVAGLLWGWHVQDKRAAVRAASEGLVTATELSAAEAERDELRRRLVAADEANRVLQERMQVAEGEAQRFATELEAYERDTQINPDGLVDPDPLQRLRAR